MKQKQSLKAQLAILLEKLHGTYEPDNVRRIGGTWYYYHNGDAIVLGVDFEQAVRRMGRILEYRTNKMAEAR